ncbi:hypothetical protein NDU88_004188 [Pleurodeles waltl]|uniref:Uncharacterized protein n=1 Tax=Pleurodeles waltl TaxID=8319 RepID=A0AAV7UIK2_PLEWA|nr:hypothetical protein NDU88_004188 [Pleurodeles waltl]
MRPCELTLEQGNMENLGASAELDRGNHQSSKRSVENAQRLDPATNQRFRNERGPDTRGARQQQNKQHCPRWQGSTERGKEASAKCKQRCQKRGQERRRRPPGRRAPGPSKRAKANNGEQISMIVQ